MKIGRLQLGIIAGLIAAALGGSVQARPAIWTVRSAHATMVLFGSIHLLPPGLDWEPPGLSEAIVNANEIWFELPINGATDSAAENLSRELGIFPKGDTLFKHLSARDGGRLNDACARLNLPPELLALMRPWLAEVTLSLAQDGQSGALASQGVEQQIWDQAPGAVRRRAFETPRQQIDFLAGASMTDQIASLDETLDEVSDDPGLYQRVVNEWLASDLPALSKDALQPLAHRSPGLYRRLISDRNRRWASRLAERLRGGGKIVVVVGTGHLLGPEGLPALLRARGFAVDGPDLDDKAAH